MRIFSQQYKPITYVVGFNLITIFIFFTAPIQWRTDNLILFAFLSLISQLSIVVGFRMGFKKSKYTVDKRYIFFQISKKNINFIFLFYFATFLLKYAYLLKFKPYQVMEMFNFLLIGLADPQLGYALSLDSSRALTLPWSVFFIISVINQLYFIVGILSWKNLDFIKRFFFIIFLIIEIFYWMGRGTNFGVISLTTTFLLCIMCQSNIKSKRIKHSVKNFLLVLALLILSISYFSNNMIKRSGDADLNFQNIDIGGAAVNENDIAFSLIPTSLHSTYMYVVLYVAQGYYHTCLAFDLEYKPTYFLTNNPALISFADIFGLNFYKDTYVFRLKEKGIDPEINWHSSYTWYASDFSFTGIPFLFFFIGYLFGLSWKFTFFNDDFLSKIVFVLLGNSLFYIFANNNYLSSIFYSFMFILPIWYFTRVKRIV